jgi:hypothetical protein
VWFSAFYLPTKKRQPSGYYPVNRIMQLSQLHFYHSTEGAKTEAKLKNETKKPDFLSCLFSARYNILISAIRLVQKWKVNA